MWPSSPAPDDGPVTAAELKAITAVRGVTHATAVWNTAWVTPFGQPVTVIAVDPASYAAVTATTPFAPFPAAAAGRRGARAGRRRGRAGARLAGRRRAAGARLDAADLAGPGGTLLGPGVGHPGQRPRRSQAAARSWSSRSCRCPAWPASPHPTWSWPADRRSTRGQLSAVVSRAMPDSHDHLPLGGAGLADKLPAAPRRRAHRRVHPGRGGRAGPAGGDPGLALGRPNAS